MTRIEDGEHPGRSLVIEDALQPMLDKAAGVGWFVGLRTQPHFERRERADNAEPGLCHDDCDCSEMRKPEPQGIDPPPRQEVARDYENQTANDKCDEGKVEREHSIGE